MSVSGSAVIGGSLPDGVYDLTIKAAGVTDAFGQILTGGDRTYTFKRLFGDATGNGAVGMADNRQLVLALGSSSGSVNYRWYLDYTGNGRIDMADNRQFVLRLGKSL